MTRLLTLIALIISGGTVSAQTFTMSQKCRELHQTALEALQNKMYSEALGLFDSFAGECKTKDAKVYAAVGKAEALNGIGEYEKAIQASDDALKITKGRNLTAHFQKAVSYNELGNSQAAKAELNEVITLTEKNVNTAERASNYALMAALYDRQLGDRDSALYYLGQAMTMDPENTDFLIQKGDMFVASNEFDKAFEAYDQAVEMGRDDLDMYIIRSEAGLKMLQHKYGTTKAQDLRTKMTLQEKSQICADLSRALELGWNDMNKDMFAALVCK